MIPRAYIIEWQRNAPWQSNAQLEQDLVIEKALLELFKDEVIRENLAFRGGTALHKIFLKPQARYSEDIDLVQISRNKIGNVLTQIRNKLEFINKIARSFSHDGNKRLIFRFESEIPPIQKLRLKIEINCNEHFSVFGLKKVNHEINNSWVSGEINMISYHLEELLATKMRALYQRKKGRDLFDLYYALTHSDIDCNKIIHAYKFYMNSSNQRYATSREFLKNMDDKMQENEFIGDVIGLIRPEIKFNILEAYSVVRQKLLVKI
jgi:predicted nucleotidyltransferase component of viral defense system